MTDRTADRIKLAEWMGWTTVRRTKEWHGETWEGVKDGEHSWRLPDPFMDANDDYAILEKMREEFTSEQIELAFDHVGFGHRWAYDVGTYAQAGLALLGSEIVRCDECKAFGEREVDSDAEDK